MATLQTLPEPAPTPAMLGAAFARHGVTECALMASTYRSGSTFVAALLAENGLEGMGKERFNHIWKAEDTDAYLDQVIAPFAGTRFASKLMWPQRNNLARRVGAPRSASVQFAQGFPGARWLFVRRRDTFRQAISFWRAKASNRWHVYEAGTEPELPYAFKPIDTAARELAFHERLWIDFFRRAMITPYTVFYEDVLAHPDILNGYLTQFGLRLKSTEVELKRQSDQRSEDYLERYLTDLYDRGD